VTADKEPPSLGPHILETDASLKPWDRKKDSATGAEALLAGGGIVLRDPKLRVVETHSVRLGYVSNATRAEYLALLLGLRRAAAIGVERLRVRNDNLSLIRTLNNPSRLSGAEPDSVVSTIRAECARFDSVEFVWARSTHSIWRSDGALSADFLARQALGLGLRSR
jgi:ribonuclease HI